MNKLLRVGIYIVCITLLYLWMSTMFNSCGSADLGDQTTDLLSQTTEEVIDVEQYFEDEEFEEGQTIDLSEDNAFGEDTFESDDIAEDTSEPDYSGLDSAIDRAFEPEEETQTYTPPVTARSTSSSGRHMVIAGNFLMRENADKMVTKLQNMGYSSAERISFDDSEYHSVIAERSNDYARAADASSRLKNNGIDNYIKTRK